MLATALLLTVECPAVAEEKFLGKFERWEASRTTDSGGATTCFIATAPVKTMGRLGKSGGATLTIAHFPKRKAFGQLRIKVGVTLKRGVPLDFEIGTKRFKLATDGDSGFAEAKDNAEMIAAIKVNQLVKVRSVPAAGLRIVDTYSLAGLSSALAAIDKECGSDRALEIRQSPDGHYYVSALINGSNIQLMVDTGATVTVLSTRHAERVGVVPNPSDYTITVRTPLGDSKAAPVQLREMRIGEALLENVPALVIATPGEVRLLGVGTLQRFRSYEVSNGVLTLRW